MNKVNVKIFGREYSLLSNKKKDDIIKIASFVDDELEQLSKNTALSKIDIAILACNNIAEKYFDEIGTELSTKFLNGKIDAQAKEIANLKLQLEQKDVKIQSLEMTDVSSQTLQAQIDKITSDYEEKIKQYQNVNDDLQAEFYDLQMKIAMYEQEIEKLKNS